MKRLLAGGAYLVLVPMLLSAAPADIDVSTRLQSAAAAREPVRINLPIGRDIRATDLEPFEVWAPGAVIAVVSESGTDYRSPEEAAYFRGRIAGDPESLVFLAVRDAGVEGIVFVDQRRYGIGSVRAERSEGGKPGRLELFTREASAEEDFPLPGDVFTCEVDGLTAPRVGEPKEIASALSIAAPQAVLSGTQRWHLNIVVDTDHELFVNAGSSVSNVETFMANLMGAASTIYSRDLSTDLSLSFLRIFTSSADPFTIVPGTSGPWTYIQESDGATVTSTITYSSLHAMAELGDLWHTPPSPAPRSSTILVSGKSPMTGIGWLGTICEPDVLCARYFDTFSGVWRSSCGHEHMNGHYAGKYAYCGGVDPPDDLSVPDPNGPVPSSNYWPLLQFTHELGHNVGSIHTHCIQLSSADQVTFGRQYVDQCFSGECFVGTTSVPVEKGTIMSYCHLSGGGSATRFIFGTSGEASYVVPPIMKSEIEGKTPAVSAITAPSSVTAGVAAEASITLGSSLSYLWTITNGSINSGGSGTTGGGGTFTVNFTATASPARLTIRVTNASGCSASDYADITVNTVNAPTNVVATATTSTNGDITVDITWTAADGATSYQVHRSVDGVDYAQVGTTTGTSLNDGLALAGVAYLYKVRSVDGSANLSAFSNIDLATTVIFTDPTLTVGATLVKAAHFSELRTAVNAVRALAGLSATSFTDATLSSAVTVKALHLSELRTSLDSARTALALGALSYTDASPTGVPIKALHLQQLRGGVQ